MQRVPARQLEGQEAPGLLQRRALGVGQVDERPETYEGGLMVVQRADAEHAGDRSVGERDLGPGRAAESRRDRPPVDRRGVDPRGREDLAARVDERDRQLEVLSQQPQDAARVGAPGHRLRERVAAADRPGELVLASTGLQLRHRLRHGGKRYVHRQCEQHKSLAPARRDQLGRRLRAVREQPEHHSTGVAGGDPRDVLVDRHPLDEPEAVGQDELGVAQIRRGVGQLGNVHPPDLALEVAGSAQHVDAQFGPADEVIEPRHV